MVNARFFEQLRNVNEVMIEMQFPGAGRLLAQRGQDSERALRQRGWKAYDAWVQLVNEIVNSLYVTPHMGASLGRLLEESLRWPRFGSSMTSAFFAGFWPTVGPPTVAGLTELRAPKYRAFTTSWRWPVWKLRKHA
jgi:hypothetical protein